MYYGNQSWWFVMSRINHLWSSVVGVGSLIDGSQNAVWPLVLEDEFLRIMKIARNCQVKCEDHSTLSSKTCTSNINFFHKWLSPLIKIYIPWQESSRFSHPAEPEWRIEKILVPWRTTGGKAELHEGEIGQWLHFQLTLLKILLIRNEHP